MIMVTGRIGVYGGSMVMVQNEFIKELMMGNLCWIEGFT